MKSRAPRRGSTLLTALGITLVLALIIFGVLAYTGAEQERSGRSVRDIDALSCAESAVQWGRKYYGDNYSDFTVTPPTSNWKHLLKASSGYTNPEELNWKKWGLGSYGRLDGQTVTDKLPADFRVTIRDNVDELPGTLPDPYVDQDNQIVLRAECLIPRLALRTSQSVESPSQREAYPDPHGWYGRVLAETSDTRRNKVVEVVLYHTGKGCDYYSQGTGDCTGDHNVSQ
jgi:hypothetical protein